MANIQNWYLLVIVLSILFLRYMDSDYSFGIFKLFLIEVVVPSMYLCVRRINFSIGFWNCSESVAFLFLFFILFNISIFNFYIIMFLSWLQMTKLSAFWENTLMKMRNWETDMWNLDNKHFEQTYVHSINVNVYLLRISYSTL